MSIRYYSDAEYVAAYEKYGSARKAGQALNVSHTSVSRAVKRSNMDEGSKAAMQAVNTKIVPDMVWAKTHKDGSTTYSVRYDPRTEFERLAIEYISEKFQDVPTLPEIKPPKQILKDLVTVYPIVDAHVGMRSWGEETGEDYDSDIAYQYISGGISKCITRSPKSEKAIILNGGDMMHADDNTNATPKSKHALDVDSRHFKTIDTVIALTSNLIAMALKHHKHVHYRALRGNHDEHSHMALTFALFERFRGNPRVTIEKIPSDFFMYEFGKVMICGHHGDKAKAVNLVLQAADKWPETWGRTRWRYYFTAHLHHEISRDVGGMQCIQFRAATKKDVYADSHSFIGKSQLRSITYHKEHGEEGRAVVNY